MRARALGPLLGLGLVAQLVCGAPNALAGNVENGRLQIYGLSLDETRLGDGFCETRTADDLVLQGCAESRQSLPRIDHIDVQTTPAPYVVLTLAPESAARPREVRIWYAPREQGGQSFMITTATPSDRDLAGAREDVLASFGAPTVEFTHADMESRGIYVADLTIDTLLYVDPDLPPAPRSRMAYRLQNAFDPTGADLFSLTDTRVRTLARLLGPDFRGAIVQISESGWSHDSTITTILLDLNRAQTIFRLTP